MKLVPFSIPGNIMKWKWSNDDVFGKICNLCSFRPPVLGPALPPGFRRAASDNNDGEDGEGFPGTALPPDHQAFTSSSEGEDEDVIGPMPAKGPVKSTVALDIERRAKMMKEKLTGEVSKLVKSLACY